MKKGLKIIREKEARVVDDKKRRRISDNELHLVDLDDINNCNNINYLVEINNNNDNINIANDINNVNNNNYNIIYFSNHITITYKNKRLNKDKLLILLYTFNIMKNY